MYHGGHGSAAASIFALLASAGFLVWVGGKAGNAYQKMAKGIGWIALLLSGLIAIGSLANCVMANLGLGSFGKGCIHQMMGRDPGMEMGRGMGGPGMGFHRGMMGPGRGMGMPPPGPGEGPRGEGPAEESAPAEKPQ